MSVLPGFDDLKPKDILVFNANGTVMIDVNGKVELYRMQLSPSGSFMARPMDRPERDQPAPRRTLSPEQRLAMTDQGQQLLGG